MIRLDPPTFEERIGELEDLFRASFDASLPAGYLRWRFLDNPTGQLLSLIEEDGPAIVANYCVSPCRLRVEGTVVQSALSMMTMTHPAYGGRGLFTRLAARLYDDMAASGYHSVWGFPNEHSHAIFAAKLGWRDIYEVPTMSVEVARLKAPAVPPARDDAFDSDYGFLAASGDGVSVFKDTSWLRWRYTRNPVHRYASYIAVSGGAVRALAVTKRYEDSLDLVDLQASDREAATEVLGMVAGAAAELGAKRVYTWMPLFSPFHALLERLGFTNGAPVTYLGARILSATQESSPLYDFRRWYVKMGDSDVY